MTLPNILYSRLSNDATLSALVGDRIFPATTQTNDVETLPYVLYDTQANPNNTLSGASTATEHNVTITAVARNLSEVQAVLAATKTLLTDWHGGNVQWSFFTSETPAAPTSDNQGYSGQQQYQIWTTDANIVTTPDSTGKITTGPDEVTLEACENVLTLDCDGLKLNGEPVGGVVDDSNYAKLDQPNTFTEDQTFDGDILGENVTITADNALNISSPSGGLSATSGNVVLSGNNVSLSGTTNVYLDGGGLTSVDPTTGSISVTNSLSCNTATTGNLTANGTVTISGTTPTLTLTHDGTGNPKIRWRQLDSSQNGIGFYKVDGSGTETQLFRIQDNGNMRFNQCLTFGGVMGINENAGFYRGNSNSGPRFKFNGGGEPMAQLSEGSGTNSYTSVLQIDIGNVGNKGLVIKGKASQTADLVQATDSTNAVQFGVAADGKVKTNQTSAGTTLGTVTGKMPVYDASGTLVGYMPIYDSIT